MSTLLNVIEIDESNIGNRSKTESTEHDFNAKHISIMELKPKSQKDPIKGMTKSTTTLILSRLILPIE